MGDNLYCTIELVDESTAPLKVLFYLGGVIFNLEGAGTGRLTTERVSFHTLARLFHQLFYVWCQKKLFLRKPVLA